MDGGSGTVTRIVIVVPGRGRGKRLQRRTSVIPDTGEQVLGQARGRVEPRAASATAKTGSI